MPKKTASHEKFMAKLRAIIALHPKSNGSVDDSRESIYADDAETDEAAGVSGDELLVELRDRSETYRAGKTTARHAADVMADLRERQARDPSN